MYLISIVLFQFTETGLVTAEEMVTRLTRSSTRRTGTPQTPTLSPLKLSVISAVKSRKSLFKQTEVNIQSIAHQSPVKNIPAATVCVPSPKKTPKKNQENVPERSAPVRASPRKIKLHQPNGILSF